MNAPAFWTARTPRERAVLSAGIATVCVLLLVVLAWLPLERARTRLVAELPLLRASATEMRVQAQEVTRLRALPARATAGITPLSTLVASGTLTQGLPGARLTTLDSKRVKLVVDDASWSRLVEWISAAQSLHGLVVDSATVDALAAPGRVRADIALVAP